MATPTPLKKVPLYLINQTKLSMMEIWIRYLRGSDNPNKKKQNFYVSSPILAGPTLTFIGDIEVLPDLKAKPMTSGEKHDSNKDSWMLYWRDETDSLNGLKLPLHADVDGTKGLVNLYVVSMDDERVVRVNQLGETSGKPGPWETLLSISQEGEIVETPAGAPKEEEAATLA